MTIMETPEKSINTNLVEDIDLLKIFFKYTNIPTYNYTNIPMYKYTNISPYKLGIMLEIN